jgi:hypothetical protein
MVGVPGFEPGTSCSQSRRATKLRHTPCYFASKSVPCTDQRARLLYAPIWRVVNLSPASGRKAIAPVVSRIFHGSGSRSKIGSGIARRINAITRHHPGTNTLRLPDAAAANISLAACWALIAGNGVRPSPI